MSLKVPSAILGRNINDHVHLIFPHDPLAARPISRPSKKLCRQPVRRDRTQKQMVLPTTANQNKYYSNQSPTRGGCWVVGFALRLIQFLSCFIWHFVNPLISVGRHGKGGCLRLVVVFSLCSSPTVEMEKSPLSVSISGLRFDGIYKMPNKTLQTHQIVKNQIVKNSVSTTISSYTTQKGGSMC